MNELRQHKFYRLHNEVISNPYNKGQRVKVRDNSYWIDATVIDTENNWIVVHYDDLPSDFDEEYHIVKHKHLIHAVPLIKEEDDCKNNNKKRRLNASGCDDHRPSKQMKLERERQLDLVKQIRQAYKLKQKQLQDAIESGQKIQKQYESSQERLNYSISAEKEMKLELMEIWQRLRELQQKYAVTLKENVRLKKREDALQRKVQDLEYKPSRIKAMDFEDLSSAKSKLQSTLKLIENAEKSLIERTLKCIICRHRQKNVYFVDGCDHVIVCDECESKMMTKQCPTCRKQYRQIKKISL